MRVALGRWVGGLWGGWDGFVKLGGVVREIGGRMDGWIGLDVCMYVMYVMSLGMMIEWYDLVRLLLLSRTLCGRLSHLRLN